MTGPKKAGRSRGSRTRGTCRVYRRLDAGRLISARSMSPPCVPPRGAGRLGTTGVARVGLADRPQDTPISMTMLATPPSGGMTTPRDTGGWRFRPVACQGLIRRVCGQRPMTASIRVSDWRNLVDGVGRTGRRYGLTEAYPPEVRASCNSQHHPETRCQRHAHGGLGDGEPVSRR